MAHVHQDKNFLIKFILQSASVRFSGWDWYTVGRLDAPILLPATDSLEKASRPFCLGHWMALWGTALLAKCSGTWSLGRWDISLDLSLPRVFSRWCLGTRTAHGRILPKEKRTETPLTFCWVCEPSVDGEKGSYSVGMETPNLVLLQAFGLCLLGRVFPCPELAPSSL